METTLIDQVRDGHHRLLDLVSELETDDFRELTQLPGWTRGHVIAHLAHNAQALGRVSSAAARGELVDLYPDDDRDAAIERDAQQDAIGLVQLMATAHAGLEIAWDSLADDDWDKPVRFRDGTITDLVLCRWREIEIHTVDLGVEYTEQDWTPQFCEHAIDFLAPRLSGASVAVDPDDLDRSWSFGDAATTVRGSCRSIACWMAGREPSRPPTVAGSLPELGPWP